MRAILIFSFLVMAANSGLAEEFPTPFNSRDDADAIATPPDEALAALQLPPGFKATLFAAEPDVQNPIALTWDARGRLWIAENFTYGDGKPHFEMDLRDRILVFEDENGDGHFDSRKVFFDDIKMLTSIEVGHGGLWLMCPPQLLFIPDANFDDIPDGPAQVVLDGFTVSETSYHNFANGLRWGPDGWLYGRCGHSCPGLIGVPGTADEKRVPLEGGMWRYHPTRKTVEVLNSGTTNPWGHDWNALGECFFINTVNGHFWHSIPGAHYMRNGESDPNPRVYQMIDQHADHWHFDTGLHWSKSRDGAANELGGGHAHSGAMIYLGDNWPAEYRGHLYTVNLHGRRLNNEIIQRSESGFVAHHGKDLLIISDPWFRGIDLSYGPDGGVMLIDWSDTGECHERTGVHRTSGRIFKITAGTPMPVATFDLRKKTDAELIELHRSPNEWFVRQSRLVLTERHIAGELQPETIPGLLQLFQSDSEIVSRLRAMLTLFTIDGIDTAFLKQQLQHPHESVRAWAVRMLTDRWQLDGPLGPVSIENERTVQIRSEAKQLTLDFVALAKTEPSGLVRLALASTLQRLPLKERPKLAQALVSRVEDAQDHNLPLLVWYGLIPAVNADPDSVLPVIAACTWPLTRTLIARRLAEEIENNPSPLGKLLTFTATQPDAYRLDILNGISQALQGWRKATPPASWAVVQSPLKESANPQIAERVRELNVLFGDGRAMSEIKAIAMNPEVPLSARKSALGQLIESRPADLKEICEKLLSDRKLALEAARGLSLFDDPQVARRLLKAYRRFKPDAREQVISILVSRPAFARLLLDQIAAGKIPPSDLTAYHVRQIHSYEDDKLTQQVTDVWGHLRDSPKEKRLQMDRLKKELTDDVLSRADLSNGRVVFQTTCGKCHRLYGEGQKIGPDLTGSNRKNLDYLLENIIDPSAVVNKNYRMTVLAMADGRILNGVITAQTNRTLTLQSLTEKITVEKSDIEQMRPTDQSPMPDSQLEKMTPEQIRDLFAYLRHSSQVPLPPKSTAPEVK